MQKKVRVKRMIRNEVPYHGYIENRVEVAERKGILILKKPMGETCATAHFG